MKTRLFFILAGSVLIIGIMNAPISFGQCKRSLMKKYLSQLPSGPLVEKKSPNRYRMTAVYTNMDQYGNFIDKTKVTGDYTREQGSGFATWNNVFISGSKGQTESFPAGLKQDYMENMQYNTADQILDEELFKNFPPGNENVLARNLIWDMKGIETFAWDYLDSLKLNTSYIISDIKGSFNMADIGTYEHENIQLCWTGISEMNDEICATIEFRALNNRINMTMEQLKTMGTELYWGTLWLSLDTRQLEYAEMYGGINQEIEIQGLKNKIQIKTIRDLEVERIY